jgi:hypothetical protein
MSPLERTITMRARGSDRSVGDGQRIMVMFVHSSGVVQRPKGPFYPQAAAE